MTKKPQSRRPKKSKPFFDPDVISTEIHQALRSDLQHTIHEYRGVDPALSLAVHRQEADFLKKYVPRTVNVAVLEDKTFSSFEAINDRMLDTNIGLLLELPDSAERIQTTSPYRTKVHLRARAIVHWVLGSLSEDEWFLECKNSSGATSGVPFMDTSLEAKFTFPMTATVSAERYFQRYLDFDFQLKSALAVYNGKEPFPGGIRGVIGSRATTVDKTVDKRRMICVEPTANMFLQQGLMQVMYSRLKAVGLDVESLQVEHKKRALEASITRREATIDFSSASDCVSIELLRWVLPPVWFDYLWALRSHHALIRESWLELHMMSTMGNATTFPLETLIFWAYGLAIKLSLRAGNSLFPEWEELKELSVYGDDCIVPVHMEEQFCSFMESVGFLVNREKSCFGNNPFRESCGGDYLTGRDVRPFYLGSPQGRRKSDLAPWLYIIANSFIKRYIQYFGTTSYLYDRELWKLLFTYFRRFKLVIRFVPPDFPDDSGLKWFFDHERLISCYRFLSEPVYEGPHGERFFSYLRFVYRERVNQNHLLRYTVGLKKTYRALSVRRGSIRDSDGFFEIGEEWRGNSFLQLPLVRELPREYPRRRVGGYVVAWSVSGHWSE